jgi:site-specific DNA-cytosine methylase
MPRDGQAATVVCTANDTNSPCVHYLHNRLPSPREQALLQTFPEDFKLKAHGSEQEQIRSWYRQVGNAVPMVVAAALGRTILDAAALSRGPQIDSARMIDRGCLMREVERA